MTHGQITFSHTCKNESDRYVLIGNCCDFISAHSTREEAAQARDQIKVSESKWAFVSLLGPGESDSTSTLTSTVYSDDNADESYYDLDKQ